MVLGGARLAARSESVLCSAGFGGTVGGLGFAGWLGYSFMYEIDAAPIWEIDGGVGFGFSIAGGLGVFELGVFCLWTGGGGGGGDVRVGFTVSRDSSLCENA